MDMKVTANRDGTYTVPGQAQDGHIWIRLSDGVLDFKGPDASTDSSADLYVTRKNWIEADVKPVGAPEASLATRLNDRNNNGNVPAG